MVPRVDAADRTGYFAVTVQTGGYSRVHARTSGDALLVAAEQFLIPLRMGLRRFAATIDSALGFDPALCHSRRT